MHGAVGEDDPAYKADLESTDAQYIKLFYLEKTHAYAVGLPVELRDNGVTDFGREHGLVWYSIWGTGLLHPERGVVIETA